MRASLKLDRRLFLKSAGGAALLTLTDVHELIANNNFSLSDSETPINVIIPRNFSPSVDYESNRYQYQLTRATLDFLQDNFSTQSMPVWKKRFGQVDFEKRITNIVYWVVRAVKEHRGIYPMDPVWVIGQIMKESYFYEFAVSGSLAIGICQFIQPTAKEYNMLCAGTRDAHHRAPYKSTGLAGKADEYYQLRQARRQYRRARKPKKRYTLEEALKIIRENNAGSHRRQAGEHLEYLQKMEDYLEKMRAASRDFKNYLQANVEGRNIFDERDLQFILGFDERFTYRKPAYSMVKMMTRALRARNGNILAAAVGYNAGLSSTIDEGLYEPYGKIPANEQATTYLSHVLINHYEISRRMG